MAALSKALVELQSTEEEHGGINESSKSRKFPLYSPQTGVYSSKYPSINLPSDPLLDVVSFIFSHKHDGQHALVDSPSGLSVPYSKLSPLVKSMAAGLHHLGVKQGDVVLILLPNSVCFPLVTLGAMSLGAVVTPMNPLSNLLELKQVLDCNPTLAFAANDKVDELVDALAGCPVVGVPEALDLNSLSTDDSVFHKLISSDPAMAPRPRIKQQDTAAILYSSGTTELTKRARRGGGSSFRRLKQVCCGAAPATEKSITDMIETLPHVDFIQGYGLTESAALGARGYNAVGAHKYTSAGLLSPNVQAKVVDWVTGAHLPPGSAGELWLRSPGNTKGYLNNNDATMVALDKNGWLHTGDIVYFDQDGYLFVIDRLKEVIKYKGFQIAPADLESVLMSHPEILDAAVTGGRDEEAGEIPVAFVVPREGSILSEAAVMNYVAKQVAPYKKVRKVYFRSSIPRSPAGKILRRELKNLLVSKL
ncbi:4-coumarate--CoA ligase-like 6 isoform X2 [Salvia splendens]|uniref:4-coumarate--CoA ligase-like 6 isoform X2 n=1 Tax=Salvia splendens TaxID=180675 RepID=UPI001C27C374|nr:4-coumarate--CoA ligase-like 6 isoform X2 [Salvia splendens]